MIIPPIGGLGGELAAAQAHSGGLGAQPNGAGATAGGESAGFGGQLTEAISSLEKTQESASSASRALATGTVSDPASAVVTVQDAKLAMDLAAQIRTKATEAAQSIFNTQV